MIEKLAIAQNLIAQGIEAALGTLEGDAPFVSATAYLFDRGENQKLGHFYLLLSGLARHTKNIQKNPKVSLLIVENKPEVSIQERKRVTVVGEIENVEPEEEKEWLCESYRKRFPWAEILFSLPDFHFYRVRPLEIHWIGGFGKIQTWTLPQ